MELESENSRAFWRLYPVIVFSGPIISVRLANGKPEFKEEEWIAYRFLRNDYEFLVDVVQSSKFSDYLRVLEKELKGYSEIR